MSYKRTLSSAQKNHIAKQQSYKCANAPGSNLKYLEDYPCLLYLLPNNNGVFDHAGYEIDHITEFHITHDDKFSNLQALCPNCHATKTSKCRIKINRGGNDKGSGKKKITKEINSKNNIINLNNSKKILIDLTEDNSETSIGDDDNESIFIDLTTSVNSTNNKINELPKYDYQRFMSKLTREQIKQLSMIINSTYNVKLSKNKMIDEIMGDYSLSDIKGKLSNVTDKKYFHRCCCLKTRMVNHQEFNDIRTAKDFEFQYPEICKDCNKKSYVSVYRNYFFGFKMDL